MYITEKGEISMTIEFCNTNVNSVAGRIWIENEMEDDIFDIIPTDEPNNLKSTTHIKLVGRETGHIYESKLVDWIEYLDIGNLRIVATWDETEVNNLLVEIGDFKDFSQVTG